MIDLLDTLKALADPTRLRLVAVLSRGELTVQELTRIFAMGQSRISRHLKILLEAGILAMKRQGTWSYYRVGEGNPFFQQIRQVMEEHLEALPQREADLASLAAILDERRRKSQEFFDRHARQWDDLVRKLLPTPDYLEALLAQVPKGGTVLEVGLGTGALLPALRARASRVIGVDHSPAMLTEARRRLAGEGIGGVDLRLGEMTHLPLTDGEAQCALLNMVLHHAADPAVVIHELARVIAPGGVLVLADLVRHGQEWVRERMADQWLGFEGTELEGWLRAAGFSAIRVETISGLPGEAEVLLVRARKSA